MTPEVNFFASLHFAKQMSDCGKRMIENHSWSRPSHDRYDALLHFRPVAMYGTFPASGLFLAVTTSAKSVVGVIQQFLAVGTQFGVSLVSSAVQAYHLFHHGHFFLYASFHRYMYAGGVVRCSCHVGLFIKKVLAVCRAATLPLRRCDGVRGKCFMPPPRVASDCPRLAVARWAAGLRCRCPGRGCCPSLRGIFSSCSPVRRP